MAQIWLTYDELGDFTNRTAAASREAAIVSGWTRRRCRDGLTRVKLPPQAATRYMVHCLCEAGMHAGNSEFVASRAIAEGG
ncbi:hypothetical protein [Methylosinus sp. PW1]|uniref:hypothetical protein n=1 Tax=Methylosinus sp. PW1 TaxID=107636 RepID=UPI0012EC37A9|nr:hypothetical protein [Methylosinus sp. PW1]